ncbi:hypothetical protein BKA70DRAFT_1295851 [Coprinopsis sp. MPI-PUGE-AT-0042]|nr:hypothetical protein BKA70DRAFT_1295851 [Coprinopsis sp. MPI-PUGE-AT-0042]
MAPDLPSELFREIINCLSKAKDLRTLQAAALVSSAFRVPCQEEIFSEVNVYKQHLYENNTNHHLAGLEILRQNGTLYRGPIFWENEAMPPCMPELIQLIATASIKRQTTPDFQRSIIACVRSPCLTSISLTFAPGALLSMVESPQCPPFKVDTRPYIFVQAASGWEAAVSRSLPQATIDFLTGDSSAVELSTVKELKLDTHEVSRGNVSLLIERCAPSLRRMRIVADVIENNMLSSRSQLHHLEELVVDEEDRGGPWRFWSQLDSILANRSRFPGLHMVKFRYTIVEPHSRTFTAGMGSNTQGYWPLLGRRE